MQSIFTIVLAICAGIYLEWRLGLVGACYVPLLLVSSTFQAKIIASHDNIEKEALASSAKVGKLCSLRDSPFIFSKPSWKVDVTIGKMLLAVRTHTG